MKYSISKEQKFALLLFLFLSIVFNAKSQYISYTISVKSDTINIIDHQNLKQGKWVVHVEPLRGEPGYEDEGVFLNDKKEGPWRKYTLNGDFIALENYKHGEKDGTSQYLTIYGDLLREENWRAYNPNSPYDTIPVYGPGNNEILSYKIIKAVPYSVKHGSWIYYNPITGLIIKREEYDRGRLLEGAPTLTTTVEDEKPMEKIKPKEVIEYDKKNNKKKKVKVRDGQTGN
jgi:antitoxin component YwqK of YwqJK toxin-antitoxin module